MCSKVAHHTSNAWLYYLAIYHYLQHIFQIDAIFLSYISQSSVATHLKRGGIFKHECVANLPPSP